ncbi:hypothetical protein G9444_2261 [Rhodococcus erythropolis]|uniref:Uncharacterized protein n=1 Tax=Rhodococcus erythropolis TaxID=1833 RepID=A0A6G9CR38_RHOER|nr:hypothetical protein G9444_2261 [Rhodococcus erythropolis]
MTLGADSRQAAQALRRIRMFGGKITVHLHRYIYQGVVSGDLVAIHLGEGRCEPCT